MTSVVSVHGSQAPTNTCFVSSRTLVSIYTAMYTAAWGWG
jgi:hypothetical protein